MVELKNYSGIYYRRWEALGAKAVFLLVHGLGAHTNRWNFLAEYLRQKKYSAYALELKGFGATQDRPRGHIDSFVIYYHDIRQLLKLINTEHPGKKVFLLGESMGGLIVFNLACLFPGEFAGQVLISPAFANGMKFPLTSYFILLTNILFNPKRTIPVPFTAAMCTRDDVYRQVMDHNPEELRVASVKLLMNILFGGLQAKVLASKLTVPSLFLLAGKDYLVDETAGRRLFASLKLKDKTLIEYPDMFHALSIDLGREIVFSDIVNWAETRL